MIRLDDVLSELTRHHPKADTNLVRRAYIFSAAAHRGQVRRNGEPYLIHPVEVSYIAGQLQLDTASVCAALLHDTVEDTETTVDQLRADFGDDIGFLVAGLTKLEKINFTNREEAQAENFRKMLVAMSRDLRVILVKLADRLHNMRTLGFLRPDKQKRIAQETLDIYAPLANRLGINWIKTELEDLCFKYLHPEAYKDLAEQLNKTRAERHSYIQRVIESLNLELGNYNIVAEVTGRPKHLWSIYQKLRTSGRDLGSLYDILAFRIMVDKVSECYEALGLVHSLWRPVPRRFKDYVALPKDNNYQSLHTAVLGPEGERIEIQIRTYEMHRVAEFGVAAHSIYKTDKYGQSDDKTSDRRFAWLRQLLEWQRDLEDPEDFMEAVKVDLFANDVYVFTPEGEVKAFPRGATPVDYAYAIHTTLGHECNGAKVNGSVVPLRYQLQNGESVQILRMKEGKPKADWLKFVKTGRAATKIRNYLRQEANARSLQIGRELIEKEMRRYGVSFNKLRKTAGFKASLEKIKYQTDKDMLIALGYGKARADGLVRSLLPENKLKGGPKEPKPDGPFQKLVKKVLPRSRGRGGIMVDGIDGVAINFPKCCSAVHGDPIVGFVTRGRGVAVHRKGCSHISHYDAARSVDVHWDSERKATRTLEIRILSSDAPGLLASVSQAFHSAGVNIAAVNCRTTDDSRAINNFTILVNDLDQLQKVMGMIRNIDGVSAVDRVSG